MILTTLQTVPGRTITEQLRYAGYRGKIAAIARYEDDHEILLSYGADKVFNFYVEAGIGFAEDSLRLIESNKPIAEAV